MRACGGPCVIESFTTFYKESPLHEKFQPSLDMSIAHLALTETKGDGKVGDLVHDSSKAVEEVSAENTGKGALLV